MSANDELRDACQEWRRLATLEGNAIRAGNWAAVAECQGALEQLQPRLLGSTEAARKEWTQSGTDADSREKSFRALIMELIEIEHSNSTLLNGVRGAAQSHLTRLNRTGHTLRQVQRSYSPAQPPVWSSFS